MSGSERTAVDGRHARRDRNRSAVLATTTRLLHDGEVFPTLQEIAERSGVSLRSVHRYFEDADDVVVAMVESYLARQGPELGFDAAPGDRTLEERIEHWVDHRVRAQRAAQMSTVAAVARANKSPRVAAVIDAARDVAVASLRELFAPELARLDDEARAATLALVHATTQIESWDNLIMRHGLDEDALRRTWTRLVTAAFSAAR